MVAVDQKYDVDQRGSVHHVMQPSSGNTEEILASSDDEFRIQIWNIQMTPMQGPILVRLGWGNSGSISSQVWQGIVSPCSLGELGPFTAPYGLQNFYVQRNDAQATNVDLYINFAYGLVQYKGALRL